MNPAVQRSLFAGNSRSGFSLLEVMLATALLAASAMVLSSLLGLGAKFGSRAEQLTETLSQAQSLLDEFLAMPTHGGELAEEVSGELPSVPARSYRIRIAPVSLGGDTNLAMTNDVRQSGSGGNGSSAQSPAGLIRVTVEIYPTSIVASGDNSLPLCQISRLVRRSRLQVTNSAAADASLLDGVP